MTWPRRRVAVLRPWPPPPATAAAAAAGGASFAAGGAFCSSPELQARAQARVTALDARLACPEAEAASGAVRYVYATTVGDGPRVLAPSESLAGPDGLPLAVAGAADGEFDKALELGRGRCGGSGGGRGRGATAARPRRRARATS